MRDQCLRLADVVVVCIDVCQEDCLSDAVTLVEHINELLDYPIMFVVGNKIDSVDRRVVSTEEARSHFESLTPPLHYIETSAKTGENVKSVFEYAIRLYRLKKNDNSRFQERLKAEGTDKKCTIQ